MLGGARSWLRRAAGLLGWSRDDLRAPRTIAGLPRILLLGPTGSGKSTLVNAMLGTDTAEARSGAPVTARLTWHTGPAWAVALGDTRGLETAEGAAQEARLRDALGALAPGDRPHLAWLVLNAESGRAHVGGGTLAALAAALHAAGIPALIVLTHAEPVEAAHARLRARVVEAMGELPVIVVNTAPLRAGDGTVLIPRHGLDALRRATEERLP